MPLEIGNTFVKQAGTIPSHLYIIISDPSANPERVVVVNLTSWRKTAVGLNDASCIVNKGEHKFIKSKSYIYYRKAICASLENLQKAIDGGAITLRENCSDALLNKILEGAAKSQFTPIGIIGVLKEQELI